MGTKLPLLKKGAEPTPQFSAHVHCGQTPEWIKMVPGIEMGLRPGQIVLDGDPAPLPKKGAGPSPISAHSYCGQTAGCIKMPLSMEVGLSPGDFVLDGDPAPPQKGGEAPNFRPISIVAKRLDGSRWHLAWRWALIQATLYWMETQLPFPKKGAEPRNFRPISVVVKRLDAPRCHLV